MDNKVWKVEINTGDETDTVYIGGADRTEANAKFEQHFGHVPEHMVTWTEIDHGDVPEDEAPL